MGQMSVSPIDPRSIDPDTTDGSELADLIGDVIAALLSQHSGSSRPSYATAQTIWVDTSGTPWIIKFFDGTDDITIGTINATTNVFSVSSPEATTAVAGLMSAADKDFIDTLLTDTLTFSGKRVTPRIGTTASGSTITPTGDTVDQYNVTALAANAAIAAPTGTPTDGQKLVIRIKDNGTARTLTWNAIYRASTDLALPTTTIISKTLYAAFIYNAADSKWDYVGASPAAGF